tara:strand:- start:649 stop:3993 length:3345 start_codon:yes stop_codon:yes gene_type:complete
MKIKSRTTHQHKSWQPTSIRLPYLSLLFILIIFTKSYATLTVSTSQTTAAVPQNNDVPIISFTISTDQENDYLTEVQITNTATYGFNDFVDGVAIFERVSIYEDSDSNSTFSTGDTELAFQETFSASTSEELTFESLVGTTIASSNITYFIVYKINDELDLGVTNTDGDYIINHTTFTTDCNLIYINSSASDDNKNINVSVTDLPISGLSINTISTNLQDKVFPSQTYVPVTYFTLSAFGEAVSNTTFSVFNEDSTFDITDDNIENGIQNVYLYQSNFTNADDLDTYTSFNISTLYSTLVETFDQSEFTSSSLIEFGSNGAIDLSRNTKYGFWVLYDIGEDISITVSETVSFEIYDVQGTGESSSLDVSLSTSNISATKFDIAAVTINDLTSEITNDFYGTYDVAPILSFYLQSINSDAIISEINIVNNGSTPFATNGEVSDIQSIYLYADNGDDVFSISTESLIGSLNLGLGNNTYNVAQVPVTLNISEFDNTESYNDNLEQKVYVLYEFGSSFTQTDNVNGNFVNAAVGDVTVSANYTYYSDNYSVSYKATGTSDEVPLELTTSQLTLTNTNVSVLEVSDLTPSYAYEGQTKIPIIKIDLHSDSTYSGSFFQLFNESDNYIDDITTGVKRIWAYIDTTSGAYPNTNTFDPSVDTFLTSSSTWECPATDTFLKSSNCTSLSNIEIPQGYSTIYVLYSAGQESNDQNFRLELSQISSDLTTIVTGGNLPNPQIAADLNIISKKLESSDITISATQSGTYPISDATKTFDIDIVINNNSTANLVISNVKPKVYSSAINGLDISYEFTTSVSSESSNTIGNTVNAGETFSISFDATHSTQFSAGKGYVDLYLEYSIQGENNEILIFERFYDTEWKMAGTNNTPGLTSSDLIEIDLKQDTTYGTNIPPYISLPLQIYREGTSSFLNGASAQTEDVIIITLTDKESIDEGSFNIVQGTETLSATSGLNCSNQGFYEYDQSNGQIKFCIRNTSETLTINGLDLYGNSLPTAYISYIVSSDVEVASPLFYPNPYIIDNSTTLKLAFSLTQLANVELYLYNFQGQLVHNASIDIGATFIGTNIYEFSLSDAFIKPGIYICKIIATDDDNKSHSKTTRLAIY